MLVEGVPVDAPFDVTLAMMCDRFHCLPSELMAEDASTMIRIWGLIGAVDSAKNERRN